MDKSGRIGSYRDTIAGRLAYLQYKAVEWMKLITQKPMRFAIAETIGISLILALVYYIDTHRGPILKRPNEKRRELRDKRRNLRIRREVAGISEPHHYHNPDEAPEGPPPDMKVKDCNECADRCTQNVNCISYDCNPKDLICQLEMKPPGPPPKHCSSLDFQILKHNKVTSSREIDIYCKGDKDADEKKKWTIWGLPSRHPGGTAVVLLILLFYAITAWFFVYARAHAPKGSNDKDTKISQVLGKTTQTLLLFGAGAVVAFLGLRAVGAAVAIILSFFPNAGGATSGDINSAEYILDFATGMGALAVLFILAKPLLDNNTRGPYLQLIKECVFYIPCLFIRFSDWISHEFKIAPHSAWVLLAIEAILITLRVLLPKIQELIVNHDGKRLLKDPIYLDLPRDLGSFELLHPTKSGGQPVFQYSFGLSAWFNLNPQPASTRRAFTRYTSILNYGNKPNISFNMQENTLRVESEAGTKNAVIAEVQGVAMQTWNNIVVNYDAGTMDVFLNGQLIGSHMNISPFMQFEAVTAGEERGLEGGICNVVYHRAPLSIRRIMMGYKMLRDKHPPVA